MEKPHRFVNIVDKDIIKVLDFCKWNEESFDNNILTGINFTQTHDKKFLLGFVFRDDKSWMISKNKAQEFGFEKVIEEEQNWLSFIGMTDQLILGNFSYKMIKVTK